MLVIKLAEQALRPKRIGALTLPLASFGDPLKRGVGQKNETSFPIFLPVLNLNQKFGGNK